MRISDWSSDVCSSDLPAGEATGTNEIIVTAQKREQSLQAVPISMEVVSGQKLAEFNSNDIKAVMNYTPNVFVQSTAGNDVIYIPGFGSPPANFAIDQSVSLYVDGVYARSEESRVGTVRVRTCRSRGSPT